MAAFRVAVEVAMSPDLAGPVAMSATPVDERLPEVQELDTVDGKAGGELHGAEIIRTGKPSMPCGRQSSPDSALDDIA